MPYDLLEKRLSRTLINADTLRFFTVEPTAESQSSKDVWRQMKAQVKDSRSTGRARQVPWDFGRLLAGEFGQAPSIAFDDSKTEHLRIGVEWQSQDQAQLELSVPSELVEQLDVLTQLHGSTLIYAAFEMVSSGYAKNSSAESSKHGFLSSANQLASHGYIDSGIDVVYDAVDEMLRHGEFPRVDAILTETQPKEYSIDIMLALLTSTLPASSRLPSRRAFYRRFETWLRTTGEYEDGLLTGLEG